MEGLPSLERCQKKCMTVVISIPPSLSYLWISACRALVVQKVAGARTMVP